MNKIQEIKLKELKLYARELKILSENEFITANDDEFILARKRQRGFKVLFEGTFDNMIGFLFGINYNRKKTS